MSKFLAVGLAVAALLLGAVAVISTPSTPSRPVVEQDVALTAANPARAQCEGREIPRRINDVVRSGRYRGQALATAIRQAIADARADCARRFPDSTTPRPTTTTPRPTTTTPRPTTTTTTPPVNTCPSGTAEITNGTIEFLQCGTGISSGDFTANVTARFGQTFGDITLYCPAGKVIIPDGAGFDTSGGAGPYTGTDGQPEGTGLVRNGEGYRVHAKSYDPERDNTLRVSIECRPKAAA
ncbi:hypothetical protein [Actinomycetospora termitidis]|uniref:Uncharacterized protein n=1 Tax=Actinomycetospora termitidis TaxID=3053470 RepID=A0ABT7ME80_9PSEU|nr:hypothetical protein [Actinomycetospora sp. Odt1-22]MDL5158970.1 hypothetical protein [Actinomycetospora sp. Odt1-22]